MYDGFCPSTVIRHIAHKPSHSCITHPDPTRPSAFVQLVAVCYRITGGGQLNRPLSEATLHSLPGASALCLDLRARARDDSAPLEYRNCFRKAQVADSATSVRRKSFDLLARVGIPVVASLLPRRRRRRLQDVARAHAHTYACVGNTDSQ